MTVPDDPYPPAGPLGPTEQTSDPDSAGDDGGRRRSRWSLRSQRRPSAPTTVGTTGARFGPPSARRPVHDEPLGAEVAAAAAADDPFVGLTGARFGSSSLRRRWHEDLTGPQENAPHRATQDPRDDARRVDDDPVEEQETLRTLVRPYTWTGGRTAPQYNLALETLVSTNDNAVSWDEELTSAEIRRVAALCARPRSVAEVAASLSIPLGVARVLLADMALAGSIVVHRAATRDGTPDLALMERVLHGLRRL
ncbi:DUF742 domain-containing protein [Streptoalloteichus hindustanus]|uniref:DUF742 domain-containing protein n=1 Tax=Streptoalloteichus hindustanus TaxID=2017 RepID=A0A1M5AIV0_STRHI|nr:DUF742 domain-containing protein [Streptoalloteichus hindustanus]SHF30240.1 Protein of unknown function [Streptoalloteichus hindustanus]